MKVGCQVILFFPLENSIGTESRTVRAHQIDMKDILILTGIIVLWFIAQRWILPRFGVKT